MNGVHDLLRVVEKSDRPRDRSEWLALGDWRTRHSLVGEALLDALRENA